MASLPGYEEATLETRSAVLDEAAAFGESVLLPLNATGDLEGCRFADGARDHAQPASARRTRSSSRAAGAGWRSRAEHGGSGLPEVLGVAFEEIACSANLAFATYPLLTAGRRRRALRARLATSRSSGCVPRLASGEWSGTMCLTEAARGHRPRPAADPRRAGRRRQLPDHRHEDLHHRRRARPDRADRAPGARPAARRARRAPRGISLFIVPKLLVGPTASRVSETASRAARSSTRWASAARPPACCTSTARSASWSARRTRGMAQMFTMMNRGPPRRRRPGRRHRRDRLPVGARLRPRAAPGAGAGGRRGGEADPIIVAPRRAPHAAADARADRGRAGTGAVARGRDGRLASPPRSRPPARRPTTWSPC